MKKIIISEDSMNISDEDYKDIKDFLDLGEMSIFTSSWLKEFEVNFTNYLNGVQTIAMPNCTSAIYTALEQINCSDNDEVIIPNLTHSSTIYPILQKRLKIRLCDFEENSYNLDLKSLQNSINSKTKAVIVCYLHGYPLNIKEIRDLCIKNNIVLIEDAAQGLGIKINGQAAGTFGDYGCFSFGENKLLRIGEGGAIHFNNKSQIEGINRTRHVGEIWADTKASTVQSNTTYGGLLKDGLDYVDMAFNFRCNPINFAIARNRLNNLDNIIKDRRKKLEYYKELLSDIESISFMGGSDCSVAPISAWITLDSKIYDVDKVMLGAINIGVPIGKFKYKTVNNIEFFKDNIINKNEKMYNSEALQKHSIFLPLYENISYNDIVNITNEFKVILKEYNNKFDERVLKDPIKYFDGFFVK